MRREELVNDAVAAFLCRLNELAEEQGCVKTWEVEEAARAMVEAALIMQVREIVAPSEN